MRYFIGLVLALALGVTGCSSGEGGTVGHLVGPAVAGVEYATTTHEGVTDRQGRFRYEEGETVRFVLGGTLLGEVAAANEVTPFDLAGAPVVTGTLRLCDALLGRFRSGHLLHTVHPCNNHHVPDPTPNEAFSALVNLVVLLQTLDEDGDPQNGIEITHEIRMLIDDTELDLSQPWEQFAQGFPFRRVIGDANENGLFSKTHGATNPAPALQQLYDSLAIDPRINAVVLASTDHDDDGIDGEADWIERVEYNTAGNWTRRDEDHDVDGVVDWYLAWEYDSRGNKTFWDTDQSDTTWEYDELGYLVRSTSGDDISTYERDAYGSLTRWTGDGGGTRQVSTWTYDEEGRPTTVELDHDGDGNSDDVSYYYYDGDGNEVRAERDADGDGSLDSVSSSEYDANGNRTRSSVDQELDGVPDFILTWEYDDHGNVTRHEVDRDADGVPDTITVAEYEYVDDGSLIRSTAVGLGDSDGDGVPEIFTTENEYDSAGRLKVEGVEYDEDGNPIRASNGTYTHLVWSYDDEGNQVREEERYNSNGLPLYVRTFQYEPTGFGYVIGEWPRD